MAKGEQDLAEPVMAAAAQVAKAVKADALFVYVHGVEDLARLHAAIKPPTRLILVCRGDQDVQRAKELSVDSLRVPSFDLSRMGQIKMATLIAFTQGLLNAGEVFVFLSGLSGRSIDTLVTDDGIPESVSDLCREHEVNLEIIAPSTPHHQSAEAAR